MFKTCFFENIFYFLTVGGNPDYLYQHQLYHTLNKTCVRHETSKLVLFMGQWTTQIVPLAVKLWWAVMSFCFCSFLFLLEGIPGTGISSDVWTSTQTCPHPALTNHHVCLFFCGNHFSNSCIWTWYQFWNTGVYFFVGTRKSNGRDNNLVQNSKNVL